MGVNVNGLRFLLHAQRSGADFTRVAMLGRQGIHMDAGAFQRVICDEFGILAQKSELLDIHSKFFADDLFRFLGADVVDSFDFSDYEGADHVHDFNTPIPKKHKNNYTLVFDGGTLEHVFFFPTALRNAMEMLSTEGSFLGVSAANNEMGHGFYQISPELYFRALSPENGFRMENVYLHEGRESRRWFEVRDPDAILQRVTLNNTVPTLLLVWARRTAIKPIFETAPLQSDYSRLWVGTATGDVGASMPPEGLRKLTGLIPALVKRPITIGKVRLVHLAQRLRILSGGGHDQRALVRFDPVVSAGRGDKIGVGQKQ